MMESVAQITVFIVTSLVGGFLAFFLAEFIFKPVQEARRYRARVHSLLVFTANVALFRDQETGAVDGRQFDRYERRVEELRRTATDMLAFCYIYPKWTRYFLRRRKIDLKKASTHLIGYSNSLDKFDGSRSKLDAAIRAALKLPEAD